VHGDGRPGGEKRPDAAAEDEVVVFDGKIASCGVSRDDVKEVQTGYECGISVENFQDIKPGDVFEVYQSKR